jgi:ribosome production factor 1
MLIHLPCGPTALFRLSNVKLNSEIEGHGQMSPHNPEVILNNFKTRLGRRVGRMLASLFYQKPDFEGRRVATFHTQRDFIFFRQHRYIFEDGESMQKMPNGKYKRVKKTIARLQELGPQFTLKLQSLQHGTFDSMHGEYEFKLTVSLSNLGFFKILIILYSLQCKSIGKNSSSDKLFYIYKIEINQRTSLS